MARQVRREKGRGHVQLSSRFQMCIVLSHPTFARKDRAGSPSRKATARIAKIVGSGKPAWSAWSAAKDSQAAPHTPHTPQGKDGGLLP